MVSLPMKLFSRKYQITGNSTLKLTGHTNVSDFTCYCRRLFPVQKFSLEYPEDGQNQTCFHATLLQIPVKSLDCGHVLMNRNLRRSLNAREHPDINIEFLKAAWKKDEKPWEMETPAKVRALTRVSINGQHNEYRLNLSGQKLSTGVYQCTGEKKLLMTDFGITPPKAMMGVVKVKDEITIDLDLVIEIR